MAVAVIVDIPGGNQQVYEQLTAKLFQDGKLPGGWQVHLVCRERGILTSGYGSRTMAYAVDCECGGSAARS